MLQESASYQNRHSEVLPSAPRSSTIWGFTEACDKVTIMLKDQIRLTAKANNVGKFFITLSAIQPGGPFIITAQSNKTGREATLENILFGDVFLCTGQSNMRLNLAADFNSKWQSEAADHYPNIRIMTIGSDESLTPLSEPRKILQRWTVVGRDVIRKFSALCWYFGRAMYDKRNIPIGLISNSVGGSRIQSWSGSDALDECCQGDKVYKEKNSIFWNAMVAPFFKMRLAGIIWYQGESNIRNDKVERTQQGKEYYSCQFPSMIKNWRAHFGNTSMYFGFVQLAAWRSRGKTYVAELREAQETALKLPMVAMATAVDLGDLKSPFGSIHPRRKRLIGERLAATARALLYGEKLVYQGPMISSISNKRKEVVISFQPSTLGSGLQKKSTLCPEELLPQHCREFEVQNKRDGKWHPAEGTIQNDTIIVSTPFGMSISGVRYGYSDWPLCTIYNKEGFPAVPFLRYLS